jgi:hypothetical protein
MNRVILSALMLVALLPGTYLLNGVVFAAEADRPSQTLFGEGYKLLYQQDQKMMHEMMETLQDMMGTMKGMAKSADKEKITKRMEQMDVLMKEHAKRASETLFGEGYAQLYQKDRAMVHEMMEMMQEMMGMMKGMAQDAGMKGKVVNRMERMDKLMKEHSEAPLKAIFGTGYPFQSR